MEVQDGFIVGVYNYCDSWCDRCAFTSYCRVFAGRAEMEVRLDPQLAAVVQAPPFPEDVEPPPPRWVQQHPREELNEACRTSIPDDEWERITPRIPSEHLAIAERAIDYGVRVHKGLKAHDTPPTSRTDDAWEIIAWYAFLIGAKTHRALTIWPGDDDKFGRTDADGSAKVALLGIERSHGAWLSLVESDAVSAVDAEPFITDLGWLGEELERLRPRARAFVRPALDEPDEVANCVARGELA